MSKGSKNRPKDEPQTEQPAAPPANGAAAESDRVMLLATETLRGDIRDMLLAEWKTRPKSWQAMNESEQESVIHRLGNIARDLVNRAVTLVAHQGSPFIIGETPKFTIKDQCKIEFVVAALPENLIKLANHRGPAVLVLVAPNKYQGQRKPAEPDVVGDLGMPREPARNETPEMP